MSHTQVSIGAASYASYPETLVLTLKPQSQAMDFMDSREIFRGLLQVQAPKA